MNICCNLSLRVQNEGLNTYIIREVLSNIAFFFQYGFICTQGFSFLMGNLRSFCAIHHACNKILYCIVLYS